MGQQKTPRLLEVPFYCWHFCFYIYA